MSACEYALCPRPSAGRTDGWELCADHIREHHEDVAEKLRDDIRQWIAAGYDDGTIAAALNSTKDQVRGIRRTVTGTFEHGSAAGYRAHQRRGERACAACRKAQSVVDAQRWAYRREADRQRRAS